MEILRLKRNCDRRVNSGGLWVYSNELSEIPKLERGSVCKLLSNNGKNYGLGFYNPNSLIAFRLLKTHSPINETFFIERISEAEQRRKRFMPEGETSYRLAFGESDLLPGLIIDKYEDYFSIQILSWGMELCREMIIAALTNVFPATKGIIEKGISHGREIEGLPQEDKVVFGDVPKSIRIKENGIELEISLSDGQKTGYFLDQKLNRKYLSGISKGARVLDCFCNQGGFALNAAKGGAESVIGVDSSESAIQAAKLNAKLNSLKNCKFITDDVFDFLDKETENNSKWDIINLDPPAFAKSKKNLATAMAAYTKINKVALGLLDRGGILISSSCSHHVDETLFEEILLKAASKADCGLRLVHKASPAPDHSSIIGMPETKYLKFYVFEKI